MPPGYLIGLVGHRTIGDPAALRAAAIPLFRAWRAAHPDALVVSQLAAGADTILTEAAAACGLPYGIIVPYAAFAADLAPDAAATYQRLLPGAAFVTTLPEAPDRDAAFDHAAHWLTEHVAVILAAWEGADSGKPGGTSAVLRQANAAGIPVFVIPVTR